MNDRYIIEREFEHAGYKCVVTFGTMGHRCGYVGIPKEHPLYGKNYTSYLGITYAGGGDKSDYPIESDLWWFGFDCIHAGDKKDLQLVYEKFPKERERVKYLMEIESKYPIKDEVVRTEEYVADECKKLAEQLKEFEEVR